MEIPTKPCHIDIVNGYSSASYGRFAVSAGRRHFAVTTIPLLISSPIETMAIVIYRVSTTFQLLELHRKHWVPK